MTPDDRVKFRERAASVRSMVVPGAAIEPIQRALILLQLDIVDAILADERTDA